jgi:hypothetical protein
MTAADVVRALQLQPHPVEGGHFRETHRDGFGTAIYYLLAAAAVSELHRLPGAEVFHWYAGDPVLQLHLHPGGRAETHALGNDLSAGQVPQLVVPGGVWQGSHPLPGPHGWTLLGATMAPGFRYEDYETGKRADLTAGWPGLDGLIAWLTPKG